MTDDQNTKRNTRKGLRGRQFVFVALIMTLLGAALSAGTISADTGDADECLRTGATLSSAKADFVAQCSEPRVDCDRIDGVWYCSDHVIGDMAPGGTNSEPQNTSVESPDSTPTPTETSDDDRSCVATGDTLRSAKDAYAVNCTQPREDCDPSGSGWVCSSESIPSNDAPAPTPTTEVPEVTPTPEVPEVTPTPEVPEVTPTPEVPENCQANTSGTADLSTDLIALHYDHAPDPDDTHATAAGHQVALRLGFEPIVVGGAHGTGNEDRYKPATEQIMDVVWGSNGWADSNRPQSVQISADRWEETLNSCGDIWIAEGGQSDFSADVVRELLDRMPGLDTEARIHLVQHSGWNEDQTNNGDLAFVQRVTDYTKIDSGNAVNDTADLNEANYRGPFIDAALESETGAGWAAALEYLPPSHKLDFSDTTELLHILGIGKDQVATVDDFAEMFF